MSYKSDNANEYARENSYNFNRFKFQMACNAILDHEIPYDNDHNPASLWKIFVPLESIEHEKKKIRLAGQVDLLRKSRVIYHIQ